MMEAVAVMLMMMLLRGRIASCLPYMLCCAPCDRLASVAYVPAHPSELRV